MSSRAVSIVASIAFFACSPIIAHAADRYVLAYWYEVGGFHNACCSGTCACSGTGNHSIFLHVLDSNGNKLGNIRVEDADNSGFYSITNNNPADKYGFTEIPLFMSHTPRMTVNDSGLASDITPEMIENRAPTNGHYSWECAFMRVPDGTQVTFDQTLLGTPNKSGDGCDIDAPTTNSCSYYDTVPSNWSSDAYSLDSGTSTYGQTFVATGNRVVIAKFQTTVGFLNDLRYGVTIRENGPGGAIVGQQQVSRLIKSDEYFTQIVTWPLEGVNACVVTAGNTYYAEITRTDQAGGINIWRRNSDVYPNGQMYRNGVAVSNMDLVGRVICATTGPAGPAGTISGYVQNDSSQPLASAEVMAQPGNYTATTNTAGQFTLSNVPVGTYSVTASKTNYYAQTLNNIAVTDSATTVVNFALSPGTTAPGVVSGMIRDLSGVPIALAYVTLSPGEYGAVSETDGTYTISNVSPGTYNITAYAPSKTEQTLTNQVLTAAGGILANFDLASSGKVAHIVDDFNGDYVFTGDTLEESFKFGIPNHEFFADGMPNFPDRRLPPYTGNDKSQKLQLESYNDQTLSYFETRSLYNANDKWLELGTFPILNGWEEIDLTKPITYIVYVKGLNDIANPDDPEWYWRQTIGVHHPDLYAGTDQIEWTSKNNNTWQMLRTSVTGLNGNYKQWISFESWYPRYLGGQVQTLNWMLWENLMIEYTPTNVDSTPPGPVMNLTATAFGTSAMLTWQNPSDDDFAGTRIRYRNDTYPTGPLDGTLLIDRATGIPSIEDSTTHMNMIEGQTYYYAAFAYDNYSNYATAAIANVAIPAPTPGDFDRDEDVDQTDFGALQICLGSAGIAPSDPACLDKDLDNDNDVDPDDYAIFQACMSGANVAASGDCAD